MTIQLKPTNAPSKDIFEEFKNACLTKNTGYIYSIWYKYPDFCVRDTYNQLINVLLNAGPEYSNSIECIIRLSDRRYDAEASRTQSNTLENVYCECCSKYLGQFLSSSITTDVFRRCIDGCDEKTSKISLPYKKKNNKYLNYK